MISPETRRSFIKAVAKAFPGSDFEEERDGNTLGLVWERNGVVAGAGIDTDRAWVFLSEQTAPADSAEDAIGLLHAIFADEIVAVAAYEDDVGVGDALANASDLHLAPHLLVPIEPSHIVRVTKLDIRSWSGALKEIRTMPQGEAG